MSLDYSTPSESGNSLLLGREIGLENGFLSIQRPNLRRITVDDLPKSVGLGAAVLVAPPAIDPTPSLRLEVIRPSGGVALSVNDTLKNADEDGGHIWARGLHLLVDEIGEWTVSVLVGQFPLIQTFSISLKEAG